jgi:hypothetical protein
MFNFLELFSYKCFLNMCWCFLNIIFRGNFNGILFDPFIEYLI